MPLRDTHITTVLALLPNKRQETYEELFRAIVAKCQEFRLHLSIEIAMTDFEDSLLRAVVVVFGRDVQNKGCFYHLTQSTWRKIQALGLAATYYTDEHFRHFVGMMDGLAFLPVEEVDAGMAYLWTIVPPAANELLQYFDDTYVSGILRHQPFDGADGAMVHHFNRRPPMFPKATWNVNQATLDGNARTNNVCEGWNNKFRSLVGHYHPSVWHCVEWFKKEEANVATVIAQTLVGNGPVKKTTRRYVQLHQRLANLCQDLLLQRVDLQQFLASVGWNIRLAA